MRERESMGEKKEGHRCCRSTCVVEEKERKRWTHMCVTKKHNSCDTFLSPD
jgi:hypothetical protein